MVPKSAGTTRVLLFLVVLLCLVVCLQILAYYTASAFMGCIIEKKEILKSLKSTQQERPRAPALVNCNCTLAHC